MNKLIQNHQYDICIVGAGIAGVFLASLLGSQNKRVLLLEKNSKLNLNGADILKPSGIAVLEKYGLLQELLDIGCPVRNKLRVFHNGFQAQEIDYRVESDRGYFMVCPYQVLLETIYAKLKKLDSVDLLISTSLTEIHETEEQVFLELTSGEKVTCDFIIGADGINSIIREYANIKADKYLYDHGMYFLKFPISKSVKEINRLYVDEKGGLAYFYPINQQEARCVLGFSLDEGKELQASNREALIKRLKQFVTESDDFLEKIVELDKFLTFPLMKMITEKYYSGRVLLIGNAAHSIHPITGQGMNLAIEDVGELFEWLCAYYNQEISLKEAFEGFQKARLQLNQKVVEYGHQLATNFGTKENFLKSLNTKVQTSSRDLAIINNI